MEFFDTHTHIDESATDIKAYYAKAAEKGVVQMLVCSSDYNNSKQNASFAKQCQNVFFAAGTHPEAVSEENLENAFAFKDFAGSTRLAAIGEIGLDFYYGSETKALQIKMLESFLTLALEMGLPCVMHCRDKDGANDAYNIMLDMLETYSKAGGRFVMHAFAGTPEMAQKYMSLGAFFGVGGMLTFKRAENIRQTVSGIPLDRIFLETDSPYLSPVPLRGKPNHPCNIPLIAEYLANMRGLSLEDIARTTTYNARNFFRI